MAAAAVFVDSRESALHESEELLQPVREGRFGPDHIVAEIGEVLLGLHPGRRHPHDVTVFDSLGLAILDVLAAWHATQAARDLGEERELDFSWAPPA
jgi:alanine dehydrogenase